MYTTHDAAARTVTRDDTFAEHFECATTIVCRDTERLITSPLQMQIEVLRDEKA
jgi:hypothetical protein